MSRNVVTYALILVVLTPLVFADNFTAIDTSGLAPLDAQNRFLAAEVTRQLTVMQTNIIKDTHDYHDQNFQIFDGRMSALMADIRMKTVLGAIGAAMVANAIIALLLLRTMKKYSYEKYMENMLVKYQKQEEAKDAPSKGLQGMQNPEWAVQQPASTLGYVKGHEFASQSTMMNQWQTQPDSGAWRAPVETQQEIMQQPYGYQPQPSQPQSPPITDPMQSPGWDPRYDNG